MDFVVVFAHDASMLPAHSGCLLRRISGSGPAISGFHSQIL
jgi:hypothetical protein